MHTSYKTQGNWPWGNGNNGTINHGVDIYLSQDDLMKIAAGYAITSFLCAYIPEPILSKALGVGFGISSVVAGYLAYEYPNGIIYTIPWIGPGFFRGQ